MDLWNQLGFSQNPYSPRPIPSTAHGEELLVGRDEELRTLKKYIKNSDTHPTLEGPNGVGKTSLVAVAGYKLHKEFLDGVSSQAFIPIGEPFQLTADDTAATFKRKLFFRIAQAFIDHHELLRSRGYVVPDVENVSLWLQSPTFGSVGGGVTILGIGASASGSTTSNTSAGFSEAGFISTVTGWLKTCFPTMAHGGFLCSIDNLELLSTSKGARGLLEALRDEVLLLDGLRWVLCGARGIVRAAASSPRMQGVLSEPTDIKPLDHKWIKDLISARLKVFAMPVGDEDDNNISSAPVEERGFEYLYSIGSNNLRNAMKYSQDFALEIECSLKGRSSDEKFDELQVWIKKIARKYLDDTTDVKPTAWSVFDKLTKSGGAMSPSEFEEYGFQSTQAMRPHIRDLELATLVESAIDETDDRRKTISITSRGWIVNFGRSSLPLKFEADDEVK
jgi:DNA polymerase III delta prime subunit